MVNEKLNIRLETVKILQVDVKEAKQIQSGKNQGKDFWGIGIKTEDGWMNTTAFSPEDRDQYAALQDKTADLSVWEEEWKDKHYTKCGFPSKTDILELRIQELEKITKRQSKFIRFYCEQNPEIVEQLKQFE